MIINYIKIAWRNLLKNKTFSIINLAGLSIIAAVIAMPVAWWAMNKWLQEFAYRTQIYWWVFVAAAAIALFIALLTVGFKAIKAAVANPVKSLRTE